MSAQCSTPTSLSPSPLSSGSALLSLPVELLYALSVELDDISLALLSATSIHFMHNPLSCRRLPIKEFITVAASHGYVSVLEWLFLECRRNVFSTLMTLAAIQAGQASVLSFIQKHYAHGFVECTSSLSSTQRYSTLVERWVSERVILSEELLVVASIAVGSLEIISWTQSHLRKTFVDFVEYMPFFPRWSLENQRREVVAFVVSLGCSYHSLSLSAACKSNNIIFLDELLAHGCTLNDKCYSVAAKHGHVEVLEWLKAHHCPRLVGDRLPLSRACEYNRVESLRWLLQNGFLCSQEEVFVCAFRGSWDALEYLIDTLIATKSTGPDLYNTFIREGFDDLVKKLRLKTHWPFTSWTAKYAIAYKRLDLLKWLHDNDCPIDFGSSVRTAAQAGSVDILEFLLDIGCPLDQDAMSVAAECGHLETLKFLYHRGLAWTDKVLFAAIRRNRRDIIDYHVSQGFPVGDDAKEAYQNYLSSYSC